MTGVGTCAYCDRTALVLLAHTDSVTGLCGRHAARELNAAVADGVLLVMTRTATAVPLAATP